MCIHFQGYYINIIIHYQELYSYYHDYNDQSIAYQSAPVASVPQPDIHGIHFLGLLLQCHGTAAVGCCGLHTRCTQIIAGISLEACTAISRMCYI